MAGSLASSLFRDGMPELDGKEMHGRACSATGGTRARRLLQRGKKDTSRT